MKRGVAWLNAEIAAIILKRRALRWWQWRQRRRAIVITEILAHASARMDRGGSPPC